MRGSAGGGSGAPGTERKKHPSSLGRAGKGVRLEDNSGDTGMDRDGQKSGVRSSADRAGLMDAAQAAGQG